MSALKNQKVLVLNKGWNAIGVVTLERAIVMAFSTYNEKMANGEWLPKAKIIDPTRSFQEFTWKQWSKLKPSGSENIIRGSNVVFRVPEVILLTKYDKLPQHKIHFSRRTIYKRDANTCQYCGCQPGTEELTIDHIMPRSAGGKTTWDNCVLACVVCNSKKADIIPDRTTMLEKVKVKDEEGRIKLKDVHVQAFTVYFNDKTKKTIKQPKKPMMPLFKGDIRIKSWEGFLGESYWLTTLDNDNDE
jgi:5-methylcytosine-specific restriction endonuclease McrA